MIEIHNHNVDSATIDFVNTLEIRASKPFKTDTPETCYREVQFVDEEHKIITVRLYSKNIENLKIMEK